MSSSVSQLALLGGPPVHRGVWPPWPRLANPSDALKNLQEVLRSSCWTIRAEVSSPSWIESFELAWAARCRSQFALAVTSGSTALELALRALGVKPGNEVLVPSMGWYATAAAVCRVGATPVFVDIDPRSTCLDAGEVGRAISRRTAALIVVHLHCAQAEMNDLIALADAHHLPLIEDAAQATGAAYQDQPIGSMGIMGCFSFNQEKLISIGEGGAVVTNDPDLYRRLYALRTDGNRPPTGNRRSLQSDGEIQGGNACLSELQAALLMSQLSSFDEDNALRNRHAEALEAALRDIPEVTILQTAHGTTTRSYYEFGFACHLEKFGDWPLSLIGEALSAELGADIHQTDEPVEISPRFALKRPPNATPQAQQVHETLLVFHHRLLLSPDIVTALPAALHKVLQVTGSHSCAEISRALVP